MTTTQIDPQKILGTTRYNGGWIKSVTGLDETKNNGYSILGTFMRASGMDNYTIGAIYLDCGIGGSRKNQSKTYTLFRVSADGCERIAKISDSADWAMRLWPAIREVLAIKPEAVNPLAQYSTDDLLAEIARRQNQN